jgi:hypothetical protein
MTTSFYKISLQINNESVPAGGEVAPPAREAILQLLNILKGVDGAPAGLQLEAYNPTIAEQAEAIPSAKWTTTGLLNPTKTLSQLAKHVQGAVDVKKDKSYTLWLNVKLTFDSASTDVPKYIATVLGKLQDIARFNSFKRSKIQAPATVALGWIPNTDGNTNTDQMEEILAHFLKFLARTRQDLHRRILETIQFECQFRKIWDGVPIKDRSASYVVNKAVHILVAKGKTDAYWPLFRQAVVEVHKAKRFNMPIRLVKDFDKFNMPPSEKLKFHRLYSWHRKAQYNMKSFKTWDIEHPDLASKSTKIYMDPTMVDEFTLRRALFSLHPSWTPGCERQPLFTALEAKSDFLTWVVSFPTLHEEEAVEVLNGLPMYISKWFSYGDLAVEMAIVRKFSLEAQQRWDEMTWDAVTRSVISANTADFNEAEESYAAPEMQWIVDIPDGNLPAAVSQPSTVASLPARPVPLDGPLNSTTLFDFASGASVATTVANSEAGHLRTINPPAYVSPEDQQKQHEDEALAAQLAAASKGNPAGATITPGTIGDMDMQNATTNPNNNATDSNPVPDPMELDLLNNQQQGASAASRSGAEEHDPRAGPPD